MPRLDFWAWATWVACAAAEALLLAVIAQSKAWRRSPALCALVAFQLISDCVLMAEAAIARTDSGAAVYFYTYWASNGIASVLRGWLILEVGQLFSRRTWRKILSIALPAIVAGLILGCSDEIHYPLWIMRFSVSFGRLTAMTWVFTFVLVTWIGDLTCVIWGRRERLIAVGMALQAIGDSLLSWALSDSPQIYAVSNFQEIACAISMLVWIAALSAKDPESAISIEELRRRSTPYIELAEALKGDH